MEPFRYHVFVCDQKKPEGVPCCCAHGSQKIIDTLRRELIARGLSNDVQVTTCGSLGLCESGPNLVVYPEGVWYSGVQPRDISEIVQSHFLGGHPVQRLVRTDPSALKFEILQNRDRYLASLKAKDAAGALPDDLHNTIRGFQESRVILTALEFDLFSAIANGATATQVAAKISTNPRATAMLMDALVSLELLRKSGEVYTNTAVSTRYFREGSPDNMRMGLMHMARLWTTWSTLTDCVKKGTSVHRDEREGTASPDFWTRAFIAAMHRNARERAPHVMRNIGLEGVSRMLDLGGGSGAYSIAFATAAPSLHIDILDLPNVLPITAEYIQQANLQNRIGLLPGDMQTAPLQTGYQLVLLSAICHMFNENQNRNLFRRAFNALEPGGRLVVQDFILEPDKTSPPFAALFSLNMLVGTEGGASYSEPEYTTWLRESGFSQVRHIELPGPSGLMIATK